MSGTILGGGHGHIDASRRCWPACPPPPPPCQLDYFRFCMCVTEGQPRFGVRTPRFTSATSASGTVGVPFSFTVRATNMEPGDVFAATGLPAWATLDPATGAITGTPTAPPANTPVTVTATNAEGASTQTLTIRVTAAAVVVGPGKFGTITTNAVPDEAMILSWSGSVANPASGTALGPVNLPIGAWGWAFAYPESLGLATEIIVSGINAIASYTRITVNVSGEDYYVYYLLNAGAAPVAGTPATLTI